MWTRHDRERILAILEDLWPGSTRRAGAPRTAAIQEWLDLLQRFSVKIAEQALRDAKREAQTDREPTLQAIGRRAADHQRALERWRKAQAEKSEPTMSGQEFACDEEFWAPREADPDPRLAEWYRKTRQRLFDGKPITPWP